MPQLDWQPENNGHIRIRGARVHNLQNVDVDIPQNQLVVITGVSGSGKSSLAIDTLYAEGRRQYLESLSTQVRQLVDQMERPDVDLVDGLPPTLCIDQHGWVQNPRSTVATITEVYDYLRLLLARVGIPHCPSCGTAIAQQTDDQIYDQLAELPDGTRLMMLAPLVRGRRGKHDDVLRQIRKAGLVRIRLNGEVLDLDDVEELNSRKTHTIEAVVDRLIIRHNEEGSGHRRLGDAITTALKLAEGTLVACYQEDGQWHDRVYSTIYACMACGLSIEEIEPRTFSFNSPYGACQVCEGLGRSEEFDSEMVLPDHSQSIATGAIAPWRGLTKAQSKKRLQGLEPFLEKHELALDLPLEAWPDGLVDKLLFGEGKKFLGLLVLLEKELATATKEKRREELEAFRGQVRCSACGGSRLRPEALGVRLLEGADGDESDSTAAPNIADITQLPISQSRQLFADLQFDEVTAEIAGPSVEEILHRLTFLEKVGVGYLTLDRPADTLSGGEMQRVRLATSIGSGLVGVCYVLDEPSIGLHPRDNDRLIAAIRQLQQHGSTVVVVEHDEAIMREADHLIDVGPTAGAGGGQIIAHGTPDEVIAASESLTGKYLAGTESIALPEKRRRIAKTRSLTIEGASANNLQEVSAMIPLETFVCVTGVSGSGKSSLINETLAPALSRRLGLTAAKPGPLASLRGVKQVDKVIRIDQSPIGRTPRSNPATYTGVFDDIRKLFAGSRDAKQRGFKANRFSFNVKGGRCEECQGQGVSRLEMNFLPDLHVTCPGCNGRRFNAQTLAVKYRGQSIADILAMSIDEALVFFENFSQIHRSLESLQAVGLGYLSLGQPSNTLSGGEAQRIKLATELARTDTGSTVYFLDEPTTGLHLDDIRRLLAVLQRLVDKGNTVIVIEHHLDVIKSADWVIDLGPEGGAAGGQVVAMGTPEEVAQVETSHTGKFLQEVLSLS